MAFDLVILASPKESTARFALVESAHLIEAAEMLRQVGGRSTSLALDVKEAADRRANAIIAETAGACALAAWAPVAGVAIETAVLATAIVRIARVYGVSLTRKEAGKFLKDMLLALGAWQAAAILGEKALASAVEATGVGYVGAASLDSVFTAAVAVGLCTAAKLYFGSDIKKGDLRRIARSSFRQARKQLRDKEELKKVTTATRVARPSYDYMSQVMQSRFGRDIVARLALTTPLVAKELADYLETADMRAEALTPAALKKLDTETGLVEELWSLARSSVDTEKLLRLACEPGSTFAILDTLAKLPGSDEAPALIPQPSAHLFMFPPGHPVAKVIYARHPLAPRIFYPLAQFHRLTFEHKVCEALVLLESLGARQLSVHHTEGMSGDIAASVAASLSGPTSPRTAAGSPFPTSANRAMTTQEGMASIYASSSQSSEILIQATYQGHAPELPSGLVWYKHEPTWQHLAEARLHRGLTSFDLHVRYTDSFGVDARLASKFIGPDGLGTQVGLGGTFHDFQATDWRVSGAFDDGGSGQERI